MAVQSHERIPRDRVVIAGPRQVSSDLGEEVVILQLREGIYFGLEAVGARVWKLLSEPRTVADLEAAILDEYEVEPERWARDLDTLLRELTDRGLIEVVEPGGGADEPDRPD